MQIRIWTSDLHDDILLHMITRSYNISAIQNRLNQFRIIGLLGPRQSGKTTLAKALNPAAFFDLENPPDFQRLQNPGLAFSTITGLIAIDEVQLQPALFPFLRYWSDNHPEQKFILLGSASRELVNKSAESLAGRIAYWELSGFNISEASSVHWRNLWHRGGYPNSFLANTEGQSMQWRLEYIRTFLERDIPGFGFQIPPAELRRFWIMLSHYHGQILNYAELGRSFGLSDVAVRRHVEILESTLMIRRLLPWYENVGKRVIKRPKIYIRDSGLFHALISAQNIEEHPKLGASWEGFALEEFLFAAKAQLAGWAEERVFFWSIQGDSEVDVFFEYAGKKYGVEFKFNESPTITTSITKTISLLNLSKVFIICPSTECYPLTDKVEVLGLLSKKFSTDLQKFLDAS